MNTIAEAFVDFIEQTKQTELFVEVKDEGSIGIVFCLGEGNKSFWIKTIFMSEPYEHLFSILS